MGLIPGWVIFGRKIIPEGGGWKGVFKNVL